MRPKQVMHKQLLTATKQCPASPQAAAAHLCKLPTVFKFFSIMSYGVECPFGQIRSAVLFLSLSACCHPSPLTARAVREAEKQLWHCTALLSNYSNISGLSALFPS